MSDIDFKNIFSQKDKKRATLWVSITLVSLILVVIIGGILRIRATSEYRDEAIEFNNKIIEAQTASKVVITTLAEFAFTLESQDSQDGTRQGIRDKQEFIDEIDYVLEILEKNKTKIDDAEGPPGSNNFGQAAISLIDFYIEELETTFRDFVDLWYEEEITDEQFSQQYEAKRKEFISRESRLVDDLKEEQRKFAQIFSLSLQKQDLELYDEFEE